MAIVIAVANQKGGCGYGKWYIMKSCLHNSLKILP